MKRDKDACILVTGAAGMIGSGVVRCLNDRGYHNLLLVDDLKQGEKWKNLVGKNFKDIVSKHKIKEVMTDVVDGIIHLGACSDTLEKDADYLVENNFRFSMRLAEWALEHDKRFVYASSAATYGDGSLGFIDDEEGIEKLKPLNMYAFSKQMLDLWMKREGALQKVTGLKYFNVFGPNEYHKGHMASMIFKMMHKARDEGAIALYKSNDPRFVDGGQCRDFVYVKDAARMTCDLFESKHMGLYNIGRGEVVSWNELADALFKALKKPARIDYIDMPVDLAKQYQNYTCADMEKFHRLFPKQFMPIGESVREYVQDYLMHSARW